MILLINNDLNIFNLFEIEKEKIYKILRDQINVHTSNRVWMKIFDPLQFNYNFNN